MEEVKKEEDKITLKDNKNHKLFRSNNWMKATIVILLFIIALLIMTIICMVEPQNKCRDNPNDTKKIEEDISSFGERLDEFTIEKDEVRQVKVNGFTINIENKKDGVYLNNHKIDFIYASGGYVLDKFLILYSNEKKAGKKLMFFDYDLNEIEMENNESLYEYLELEEGKLKTKISNFDGQPSCKIYGGIEICECSNGEKANLKEYEEYLSDYSDKVISGEGSLVYKDNKIVLEYDNKVTVIEYYSSDIEGETNKYCAKEH